MKELSDNPHLVIKKGDKGSAIVIMNTNDYIREAPRQLTNPDNYLPLDSEPKDPVTHEVRINKDHLRPKKPRDQR